ncbi:fimbrial protein [Pantoea sp. SOD02]|uniref:fimbrial protein n=1 Tax=Pantoea sp. SOD02 TaxID=2970818 RepID=UPI002158524D|nr:fimbrial protein [Pantoea sp. SOD02]UVC29811.1 type 1 fimbrial protein [Pantoea sp. SOD02]
MKKANLILLHMLFTITVVMTHHARATDMQFSGALVAEPCVIAPGKENIDLYFGTLADKYLYHNFRSPNKSFSIELTGCTPNVGQSVAVTFTGIENAELTGLLAIDPGSAASGIAIGMETANGLPLKINSLSNKMRLVNGNNDISLRAYVQAEKSALKNKKIGLGTFNATASFTLTYD